MQGNSFCENLEQKLCSPEPLEIMVSIEKIPSKKLLQEEFLASEKYIALQKEVAESIAGINFEDANKGNQDRSPLFDYFEKEVQRVGLSELQAERLFWQTVAEQIKESSFRAIYEEIHKAIAFFA